MAQNGFTFIEVLVAMAIFVIASVAAINITTGAVQATHDSKYMTIATFLAQKIMVELETQIETKGFDEGCFKEKEGKFDSPYNNYSWKTYCDEIDFYLSDTISNLLEATENKESEEPQINKNQIVSILIKNANDFISKAIRELHVEVFWEHKNEIRKVSLTTYVANYNEKL